MEIEVGSLAINTILQADYLREFEDALELSGVDSKKKAKDNAQAEFDTDLDEFVTCRAAFQKLKDLMNRWLQDIHNEDEYADDEDFCFLDCSVSDVLTFLTEGLSCSSVRSMTSSALSEALFIISCFKVLCNNYKSK